MTGRIYEVCEYVIEDMREAVKEELGYRTSTTHIFYYYYYFNFFASLINSLKKNPLKKGNIFFILSNLSN